MKAQKWSRQPQIERGLRFSSRMNPTDPVLAQPIFHRHCQLQSGRALWLVLFILCLAGNCIVAQAQAAGEPRAADARSVAQTGGLFFSKGPGGREIIDLASEVYLSCFKGGGVQKFTSDGVSLGMFCDVVGATGVAFDKNGNLYVAKDEAPDYSIEKFTPHGAHSTFATEGLSAPHALAFDNAGNLFVANAQNATIEKYTPAGVGTVFATASSGLVHPADLTFDTAGNLWVVDPFGGSDQKGIVVKFTPDGTGTIFASSGFNGAYGIAIDGAGNVYVSNLKGNNVLKFAPDGTNLGVFCSTPLHIPHGMFFDSSGILYVANSVNSTIEKFSPTGVYLGVFASTGPGPHFFALSHSPASPPPTPTPTPTPSGTPSPTPTQTPTPVPPAIDRQPVDTSAFIGESATFSVRASGGKPLFYQWQKNGEIISGAIQATYFTPPVTELDDGSFFQVIVTNGGGSVASDTVSLTISTPPVITIQPADRTVAVGRTAKFQVAASGKGLTYQWRNNGTNISGAEMASYTTPPATTEDNGSFFSVVVTNPAGSVTSDNATLTVK